MSFRTPVQIDEIREERFETWQQAVRFLIGNWNTNAAKFNDLINSIKRAGIAESTTTILAGGGILVTSGGGGSGSADAGHRAGVNAISTAETVIAFSTPISGSFVLNKPRAYLTADPIVSVDGLEVYDVSSAGFKVKSPIDDTTMEWSTTGVA